MKGHTPGHIAKLIPSGIAGCYIVERMYVRAYQGFYPDAFPGSRGATWEGRAMLTRAQALEQVVNWVLRRHKDATTQDLGQISSVDAEAAIAEAEGGVAEAVAVDVGAAGPGAVAVDAAARLGVYE